MRNERGVVTIEFIFSLVIAGGLSALLFSVSYTLAVIEVTQYVAFSTARAHMAGARDPLTQRQNAINKFKALTTGNSAIASLFRPGWFEIAKPDQLDIRGGPTGDGKTFGADLAGGSDRPNRNWFMGVSIPLTASVLTMRLPSLGSTNPEDDNKIFKTRLNAMLIRDPSQKECQDFYEARRRALGNLPSGRSFYKASSYEILEDNGC